MKSSRITSAATYGKYIIFPLNLRCSISRSSFESRLFRSVNPENRDLLPLLSPACPDLSGIHRGRVGVPPIPPVPIHRGGVGEE